MSSKAGRKDKYEIELPDWFDLDMYDMPPMYLDGVTDKDGNPVVDREFLTLYWYQQIRARNRIATKIAHDELDPKVVLADLPNTIADSIRHIQSLTKETGRRNIENDDSDGKAVKELRVLDMMYLAEGLDDDELKLIEKRAHVRKYYDGDLDRPNVRLRSRIDQIITDNSAARPARTDYSGAWDRLYSDPVFFSADLNSTDDVIVKQLKHLLKQLRDEKNEDRKKFKTISDLDLRTWTTMKYTMLWDLQFWLNQTYLDGDKVISGSLIFKKGFGDKCGEKLEVYEFLESLGRGANSEESAAAVGNAITGTHIPNLHSVFNNKTVGKLIEAHRQAKAIKAENELKAAKKAAKEAAVS